MADDAPPRGAWHVAARSSELKRGRVLGREDLGGSILVGRTRVGAVYALSNLCPHRGARLSAGKVRMEAGGETVECPYHGWRFRTDGACAAIPSLGADSPMDLSRVRVKTYTVVETRGRVWVWISTDPRFEGEPPEPPPQVPTDPWGRWLGWLKRG